MTKDDRSEATRLLGGYRPHLDGLRAVAVYLVVAFHTGSVSMLGGFIGVDIFFVLSGFLVTRVILTAYDGGRFTFATFYSRRVRRLLPAAIATVLGTAVVYAAVATPADLLAATDGFRASLLYFANWHFISESTDYFAGEIGRSPVLHFWSLSIEEQFYLLWPLLLVAMLTLSRGARSGRRAVRATVCVAAVSSLVWALYLATIDLNRAYYGTDARAYQLLGGALLGLSPSLFMRFRDRRSAGALAALSLIGLLVLATSAVGVGPITRGALATALTLVLLVALEAGPGRLRSLLSVEPITYLGQISYGTYLCHWPVIIITSLLIEVSPASMFVFASVVATSLAALSSRMLEMPIRNTKLVLPVPRTVVAAGLAASVIAGLVLIPVITEPDPVTATTSSALEGDGGGASIDWQAASADRSTPIRCPDDPVDCVIVEGTGQHLALVGDSHALMFVPALRQFALDNDLTLSVAADGGCSWPRGLTYPTQEPALRDQCRAFQDYWYDTLIPSLDPDVVVLALRLPDDPNRPIDVIDESGTLVEATKEAGAPQTAVAETVARLAEASLDNLVADGREVIIIEGVPGTSNRNDPLKCLSAADNPDECRFTANGEPTPLEVFFRDLEATTPTVSTVDIDGLLCPALPRCDGVIDGMVVRWDSHHITQTYSASISEELGTTLIDTGFIDTD